MVIMVDIDGVCANFVQGFAQLATRVTGKIVPEVAEVWNWYDACLTTEEIHTVWEWIRDNPAWWTTLNPLPGAAQGLSALWRNRATVETYFISHRMAGAKAATERWLTAYGYENPTVLLTKKKATVAKALGVEKGIEDLVDTATVLQSNGVQMTLMAVPYTRASGWPGPWAESLMAWVQQEVHV